MRQSTMITASILACLVAATTAYALTVPYGKREIAKAGVGCVGGLSSAHGDTAYFRGDTELLNKQLASMANDKRSIKVVLHAGAATVDNPEETPLTGFGDQTRDKLSVDWSVSKNCPFESVRSGACRCDELNVTVHIWVANDIRLDDLIVPEKFVVRSAGEIDDFVKRHAEIK